MSLVANTRLLEGTILEVDDLDDGYLTFDGIIDIPQGFSSPSTRIDVGTAAGRKNIVGLKDLGEATFNYNYNGDNVFMQEMDIMYNDLTQVRKFRLTIIEGTKRQKVFTAQVMNNTPTSASVNDVVRGTLTLLIVSAEPWAAPEVDE